MIYTMMSNVRARRHAVRTIVYLVIRAVRFEHLQRLLSQGDR